MEQAKYVNFYKKKYIYKIYLIFILDFISKQWIINHLRLYKIIYIFPYLNLFYIQNYGIAFNIFSEYTKYYKFIFLIINIIIIIIIINQFKYPNQKIGLIFILGGGIGNIFDRIKYGYIIDFIDIHFKNYHFATFNISDINIFIGIMIIFFNFKRKIY